MKPIHERVSLTGELETYGIVAENVCCIAQSICGLTN
jgi:hypothetical protein